MSGKWRMQDGPRIQVIMGRDISSRKELFASLHWHQGVQQEAAHEIIFICSIPSLKNSCKSILCCFFMATRKNTARRSGGSVPISLPWTLCEDLLQQQNLTVFAFLPSVDEEGLISAFGLCSDPRLSYPSLMREAVLFERLCRIVPGFL